MSGARRKRRAVVLLALALACGGLAASRVQTREREVEAAVGPLVPVVVTRADVPAGGRPEPPTPAARRGAGPESRNCAPCERCGRGSRRETLSRRPTRWPASAWKRRWRRAAT